MRTLLCPTQPPAAPRCFLPLFPSQEEGRGPRRQLLNVRHPQGFWEETGRPACLPLPRLDPDTSARFESSRLACFPGAHTQELDAYVEVVGDAIYFRRPIIVEPTGNLGSSGLPALTLRKGTLTGAQAFSADEKYRDAGGPWQYRQATLVYWDGRSSFSAPMQIMTSAPWPNPDGSERPGARQKAVWEQGAGGAAGQAVACTC